MVHLIQLSLIINIVAVMHGIIFSFQDEFSCSVCTVHTVAEVRWKAFGSFEFRVK